MASQEIVIASWTPQILMTIWAIAQSLILEYFPYAAEWYEPLAKRWKRFIQAAGLLVMSLIVFGLGCGNVIEGLDCNQAGIIEIFMVWVWSLMANLTTHAYAKKDKES